MVVTKEMHDDWKEFGFIPSLKGIELSVEDLQLIDEQLDLWDLAEQYIEKGDADGLHEVITALAQYE